MLIALLGSAAALGAIGTVHCAAMCGPIAAAACGGSRPRHEMVSYLLARLAGYGLVGALLGMLGPALPPRALVPLQSALLIVAALVLIARGLVGLLPGRTPLVRIRAASARAGLLGAMVGVLPKRGAVLGALTAVLPCGQLIAAWALAASAGRPVASAAVMGVFALATTPGLLAPIAASLAARGWVGRLSPRRVGALWCLLGVLLFARAVSFGWGGLEEGAGACHG